MINPERLRTLENQLVEALKIYPRELIDVETLVDIISGLDSRPNLYSDRRRYAVRLARNLVDRDLARVVSEEEWRLDLVAVDSAIAISAPVPVRDTRVLYRYRVSASSEVEEQESAAAAREVFELLGFDLEKSVLKVDVSRDAVPDFQPVVIVSKSLGGSREI